MPITSLSTLAQAELYMATTAFCTIIIFCFATDGFNKKTGFKILVGLIAVVSFIVLINSRFQSMLASIDEGRTRAENISFGVIYEFKESVTLEVGKTYGIDYFVEDPYTMTDGLRFKIYNSANEEEYPDWYEISNRTITILSEPQVRYVTIYDGYSRPNYVNVIFE